MSTSRRSFLSTTLTTGIAAAAGMSTVAGRVRASIGLQPAPQTATKPQRVLILGGTGFLGPHCIDSLLARGHQVTVFNRGATEDRRKRAGRPSAIPAGVEVLYGNRDPNKTADSDDNAATGDLPANPSGESPKGLSQLEGKTWDAVIDTSGYWPRMVRASAELLAKNVRQYVFISSISVYADNSKPGSDESNPVGELTEPEREEFGAGFERYGPGKAACEAAAEAAMPGRVTNLRPGFIVGPRDTSARFLYWPVRARRGDEMILPGAPEDPIQVVDVRDLADFIVTTIENNTTGVFNVTGPAKELSMKSFIEQIKAGAGGVASTYAHIPVDFLASQNVPGGALPLHVPPTGETAGFHRVSVAKALAAGLKFRALSDTAKATLAWFDELPDDTKAKILPSGPLAIPPEREKEIIAAWRASQAGGGGR